MLNVSWCSPVVLNLKCITERERVIVVGCSSSFSLIGPNERSANRCFLVNIMSLSCFFPSRGCQDLCARKKTKKISGDSFLFLSFPFTLDPPPSKKIGKRKKRRKVDLSRNCSWKRLYLNETLVLRRQPLLQLGAWDDTTKAGLVPLKKKGSACNELASYTSSGWKKGDLARKALTAIRALLSAYTIYTYLAASFTLYYFYSTRLLYSFTLFVWDLQNVKRRRREVLWAG